MHGSALRMCVCQLKGAGNTLAHSCRSGPWLLLSKSLPAGSSCFHSCPPWFTLHTMLLDLGHQDPELVESRQTHLFLLMGSLEILWADVPRIHTYL